MLHEQMAHIATLARLNPSAEQLERFAAQCSDIIGYVDLLAEVDTEGIAPLYSPIEDVVTHAAGDAVTGSPCSLGGRPDIVRPSSLRPTREEVLSNAPESDGSFFIVPRIV